MKKKLSQWICAAALCSAPLLTTAQNSAPAGSPESLLNEGRTRFLQKNYAAAITPLAAFVQQSRQASLLQEAEYMLACSAYELQEPDRILLLRSYLERFPDTPYANRIYSLLASCYYYERQYDEALALFNSCELDKLSDEERDERTYLMAQAYMETGNTKEAAIWFETLKNSSGKYQEDCIYYLSYIRYTRKMYDEALKGFLSIQGNEKYKESVPYYIADIYNEKRNYDKGEIVAQNYLSAYPDNEHSAEMHRILGTSYYHFKRYQDATEHFNAYLSDTSSPRIDVSYMAGISYFHTQVYSKAIPLLEAASRNPSIAQNADLHLGIAYLSTGDKAKARMAFGRAASSDADQQIKEEAMYNYALCLHETSYSAFGESVKAFERFLNTFPRSVYANQVNNYLIEVYMNTRSYDAALASIQRIQNPGSRILEAKQKILFQLGTQAFANSAFKQAISYFDQAIDLGQYNKQTQADAYYWKGESNYRLNYMSEAASYFKAYLNTTTDKRSEMYALAYYNLGYISFHLKGYSQAENYFKQYIRLEQGQNKDALADAYNRIGDCHMRVRDFAQATSYYSQAAQTEASAGAYANYQIALMDGLQKNYDGKIGRLNNLIARYPKSPYVANAYYEKGRAYVQAGDNVEAIATFKTMLSKYPEHPASRKAAAEIGLLHYQDGNYNQAIEAYKLVLAKYPGSEEAKLALRDLKTIFVDQDRVEAYAQLVNSLPGQIGLDANEQDALTYEAAEKVYMRGKTAEAQQSFTRYLQKYPQGAYSLNASYYLCLIASQQGNETEVITRSELLMNYPDNPYAQEGLALRAAALYNQSQYEPALQTYRLLAEKAQTADKRQMGETGVMRCAFKLQADSTTLKAADALLVSESKVNPELEAEARYCRAKTYLHLQQADQALPDLQTLAQDTRNVYGAEARYLIAQHDYDTRQYQEAEKKLLAYMDEGTPHAYWMARSFILLADVYVAMNKPEDARQYLLSLQQNYQAEDDIAGMIEARLEKLNKEETE